MVKGLLGLDQISRVRMVAQWGQHGVVWAMQQVVKNSHLMEEIQILGARG